jgi:outer membrane protein OmpA-like peptidoglycan-associated protein
MNRFGALLIALAALPRLAAAQDYKPYQNYDFVAGDKIIFEDDFSSDTDGEFASHWRLLAGQAVVNKIDGQPALLLTDGNYARVSPRLKGDDYVPDVFTIEFDFFPKAGGYEKILVTFKSDEFERSVVFGSDVSTEGSEHDLSGSFPGGGEAFQNKWHHLALVYKNGQLKAYEDQNRVLVAPDFGENYNPRTFTIAGIGDQQNPLIIRNFRFAEGGSMNTLQALSKDGKVISHILFDVNSAVVKPPSMGAILDIAKALKADASLKLEIGGHTDSDGDAARNVTLSQARADAIKTLLVQQGIDAARLSTKGYGAAKPIAPNDSPEGKANNRRVEFAKVG